MLGKGDCKIQGFSRIKKQRDYWEDGVFGWKQDKSESDFNCYMILCECVYAPWWFPNIVMVQLHTSMYFGGDLIWWEKTKQSRFPAMFHAALLLFPSSSCWLLVADFSHLCCLSETCLNRVYTDSVQAAFEWSTSRSSVCVLDVFSATWPLTSLDPHLFCDYDWFQIWL